MTIKAIMSKKLPISKLPFSHGFQAERFIFTSGQVGVNPQTGQLAEGIEAQTRQTLENVEAVLEAAGYTRRDVIKATVFLANIQDYSAMNKVYSAFFSNPYPARSCVEAKLANPNIRVEIESVAYRY
jgi:2-iminobutanoate/2-iminopropanoate deaminase